MPEQEMELNGELPCNAEHIAECLPVEVLGEPLTEVAPLEVFEAPLLAARNPVWNQHGTIDCEVEHPQLGWIPFHATACDCEPSGRQIHANALAGVYGPIGPYVASTLSREQFEFERAQAVAGITVEVDGLVLRGDEASQNRLLRAIHCLRGQPHGTTMAWELADNSVVAMTLYQLERALTLAFEQQQVLWFPAD